MPDLSHLYTQRILQHLNGEATWTAPAGLWLTLATAAPDMDGTPTNELVGMNRVAGAGLLVVNTAAPVSLTNSGGPVTFLDCPAGTVTHVLLMDDATAGNLVGAMEIVDGSNVPTPVAVVEGASLVFYANQLLFTGA